MLRKILVILIVASLSGCMATNQEVLGLRDDISQLQIKINELQQNQADLSVKMDKVISNIDPLNYELKETQDKMSSLSQRLDDAQAGILSKMDKLSVKISGAPLPTAPTPTQIYNASCRDYSSGNYDLAIKGFSSYLKEFPDTEMAPQAQYYLGDSYLSEKNYDSAVKAFQAVEKNYPKSELIAASMLKEAAVLEFMGKKQEAINIYENLVKDHPNASEASQAKEKLGVKETNAK